MNRRAASSVIFAGLIVPRSIAMAGQPIVFTGIISGVGSGGYDPVSYLQASGPKMGDSSKAATWNGAKWYFASDENLAKFKAAPEKYAPQFGGYCAFAVAKGSLAKGDPKVFTVVEGKVYLNLSPSVQQIWQSDIPGNIASATAKWPGLVQ